MTDRERRGPDRDGYRLIIIISVIVTGSALFAAIGAAVEDDFTTAQRVGVPLGMALPLTLAPFFIYKAIRGLQRLKDDE